MTRAWTIAVALVALAFHAVAANPARADGPIDPNGTTITTSSYSIDGARGSVLSSSRVTGLSGAFSAIAEGVEGGLSNPASVAVRFPGSVERWDYWLAAGVTFPADNGDYFNSGGYLDTSGIGEASFYFVNPGVYFQLYGVGVGLNVEVQGLELTSDAGTPMESQITLELVTTHLQVGYRFLDGQLVLGGGLQVLVEAIDGGPTGAPLEPLHDAHGFGGEVGFLIRPNDSPWRLGGGLYSTVRTEGRRDGGGDVIVNDGMRDIYLPRYTVNPWRASLAFAYQLGNRPFNPRWTYVEEMAEEPLAATDARREAAIAPLEARLEALRAAGSENEADALERQIDELEDMFDAEEGAVKKETWRTLRRRVREVWPRRYALLTAQLDVTSRVHSGVGFESFLAQTVQRSGERVTVTPRVGIETEVWPTWLKLRAGMYVEPTRFAHSDPRVHGTFGLDLRVVRWDVFGLWPEDYLWQISAAIDGTPGYIAFSFSLGGWY